MKTKFLLVLALAMVSVLGANARVIRISEADQAKTFFNLYAGDTLELAEGTWTDVDVRFRSIDGTKENPVYFRGETAGKTIMKGLSTVSFSGRGVIVEDLWFEDPQSDSFEKSIVKFRTSDMVASDAHESTLRNCRFTGYNDVMEYQEDIICQWVGLYGLDNVVENCSFEDKGWMGVIIAVWTEPGYGRAGNSIIRNNYFSRPRSVVDERGAKYNGQEVIRIGTSHISMEESGCTVEYNVFEECSGEAEIASSKTGNNVFRGNVFLGCQGTLTIRLGDAAIVEDNYFDGRNIPETGGIRIVGVDHVVRNNYMQNLGGTGNNSAIGITMGVVDAVINSYFQVSNNVFEGNVVVDCAQALAINIGNRAGQEEPFTNSRFENNVFAGNAITARVASPDPTDVVWANNVFEGGEFINTSADKLGGVKASSTIERREAPVLEVGPSWKNLYQ